MKIEEVAERYPILSDAVARVRKVEEIQELYPPQTKAIKKGAIENDAVLSFPTASGKTLISEFAMLRGILQEGGKAIYIVPLKALANQKYQEFKAKYQPLGIKIARSTGDFDSKDPWLKNYDIIVASSEKTDSLIRHDAEWLEDLSVVVADEVHLVNSPQRGPTLEITLTHLMDMHPNLQFLLLSATLSNADDLAEWMDGTLIESDFRPVKLFEGIYYDGTIRFENKEEYRVRNGSKRATIALAEDTLKKDKQAIVFVSTRRSAEAVARRLSKVTGRPLEGGQREELKQLSEEIHHVLEHPTPQCEKIAKYVRRGAAFHHAGLSARQKVLIENNFRKGLIKFIAATPSLAMGVDLPAFRVILRDTKRYTGEGMQWIPTLEYEQISGRAGRPKYDPYGEAILVAKSESKIDKLKERYVRGEPEAIDSKLAVEPVLRMHVLTIICEGYSSMTQLTDFFAKTFYGYLYGSATALSSQLRRVLKHLREFTFVNVDNRKLTATSLGRRVSELYIDPLTAHNLITFMKKAQEQQFDEIAYLTAICDTTEMQPLPSVRKSEREHIKQEMSRRREQLLPIPMDRYDYFRVQRAFKMALVLESWIHEKGEDAIFNRYSVTPGGLFAKLSIADWLLYGCSELAQLLHLQKARQTVENLKVRVKHGVKEELIDLVQVKGIGRVRARKIHKKGIKDVNDIVTTPVKRLKHILGPKLGEKIKRRASQKRH